MAKINNKDKELEEKKCVDCGSVVYITHGHARRKPPDYKWRCKSCMSKHRSEIQKNSPTNIAKINLELMKDPKKSVKLKKGQRDRAIDRWNSKTEDEKRLHVEKLQKGLHDAWDKNREEFTKTRKETLDNYYSNRTDEQKKNHRDMISKSRKIYFANMTPEEFEIYRKIFKDAWNSKSEEEKEEVRNKSIEQWQRLTPEEYEEICKRFSIAGKKRWDSMSLEERIHHGKKISEGLLNISLEKRNEINDKLRQRWENMDPEEKYSYIHKTLSNSKSGSNNLHERFELYFHNSYISNEYFIKPEVLSINKEYSKSWDYGIYNKNDNTLVMLVDLDGAYYHADRYDYDGIHSKEEYDEKRLLSVPTGIKYCFIYEKKFKESFINMIKDLIINYDEFIESQFNMCMKMSFPYPKYSDTELHRSYDYLCRMKCNDKLHKNISLNTRLGDRLITHFHPSIYHAHIKGKPSPYDAWYNRDLLRKCIENRVIYVNELNPNKILQGFNVSKIAPKVSVFSAGRAKLIIYKYLNDYDTIFDPFSGFGGRMLGAVSLNKHYIGQDISDRHIKENMDIINFLKLDDFVSLTCKDIFKSSGSYECLFTCPPYGDKEFWNGINSSIKSCDDWIDEMIKRFKCKRYVFVVDETEKYQKYIIDVIDNKSHFGINNEKILLIERND